VTLDVMAVDGLGTRALSAAVQVVVRLTDVNDNAPTFDITIHTLVLSESIDPNTTFFTVNATDPDLGDNGKVGYALANGADVFSVDALTGEVSCRSSLDRETLAAYTLRLVAHDHGQPARSSVMTLRVLLEDINDNSPVFYPLLYFATLPVKRSALPVAHLLASDNDLGVNATLQFHWSVTEAEQMPLRLDVDSGKLFQHKSLLF